MSHSPASKGRPRESDEVADCRIAAAVTRSDRDRLMTYARAVDRSSSSVIRQLIRSHLQPIHLPPVDSPDRPVRAYEITWRHEDGDVIAEVGELPGTRWSFRAYDDAARAHAEKLLRGLAGGPLDITHAAPTP